MLKEKCGKSKLAVFEYEAQQKVKKQTCDEFEEYSLSKTLLMKHLIC